MRKWFACIFVLTISYLWAGCGPIDDNNNQTPTCTTPQLVEEDISSDTTWGASGPPCYEVTDRISVSGTLTIEPGVLVQFQEKAGLIIDSSGIMIAEGTDSSPITFTGTTKSRGWWNSILFDGSDHQDNSLENIVVEYAGSGSPATKHTSGLEAGGLVLGQRGEPASVSVTNSVFRSNDGTGLYVHSDATLSDFGSNEFKNNGKPLNIEANDLKDIGTSSTFSENDENVVFVRGGSTSGETTWSPPGVPFRVTDNVSVTDGHTTIEAGVEARFANEKAMGVAEGASLAVEGTEDEKVLLTGTDQSTGWWKGLWFVKSKHPDNSLNHLIVEYAGNDTQSDKHTPGNSPAGLTVGQRGDEAKVAVTNSTFRNNKGYGLWMNENGAFHEFSSNTFESNKIPLSIKSHHVDAIGTESTFEGHETSAIELRGGATQSETTWRDPGIPWRATGSVQINAVKTTMKPNTRVNFAFTDDGLNLEVQEGGALSIEGTEDKPVVLSGVDSMPGWWRGLWYKKSKHPSNSVEHAIVEYAGHTKQNDKHTSGNNPAGLTVGQRGDDAQVSVTQSTFRNNKGYGIWVNENGSANGDICSANTFENNESAACEVDKSN